MKYSNAKLPQYLALFSLLLVVSCGGGGSSSSPASTPTSIYDHPASVATDGTYVYVADIYNNSIHKITLSTKAVTTLAGTGLQGSNNATGTLASFSFPYGVAIDSTNVYVADTYNHTIRMITPSSGSLGAMTSANALVTTLAGTTGAQGSADLIGTFASFKYPHGVASDGTNLYVADTTNNTIRQIVINTGVVTTLAGTTGTAFPYVNGTGTAATFSAPQGIASDGTNLYVADTGNNGIRMIVISTGVVTTLAGSTAGTAGYSNNTGTSATFSAPQGIASDGTNLYVADTGNNVIRMIVISTGVVTTLAGSTTGTAGSTDGTGTAARFSAPQGIAVDGSGNVYVADTGNNAIRKITAGGVVSTL